MVRCGVFPSRLVVCVIFMRHSLLSLSLSLSRYVHERCPLILSLSEPFTASYQSFLCLLHTAQDRYSFDMLHAHTCPCLCPCPPLLILARFLFLTYDLRTQVSDSQTNEKCRDAPFFDMCYNLSVLNLVCFGLFRLMLSSVCGVSSALITLMRSLAGVLVIVLCRGGSRVS